MRAIGTELITFGAGLPVLYLVAADVFLGGVTPAAVMFVGTLSFLLIALGRELRARGTRASTKLADAARLVGSDAPRGGIDHDANPANVGRAKGLESRKTPVDPTRLIA